MKRKTYFILVASLALCAFAAHAATDWDSHGWKKLGERTINGRVEADKIAISRYDGVHSKLALRVEAGQFELTDLSVTFTAGAAFHPALRHVFKEGARTRVIDLPAGNRIIKSIDFKYKNIPGHGGARLDIWAR